MKVSVQDESIQTVTLGEVERHIQRVSIVGITVTVLACYVAYLVIPSVIQLPTNTVDALVFGLQLSLVPLLWLFFAIANIAKKRRQSLSDARGSAFGMSSESLRLPLAFLQNTLEQTVLLVGALLILAVHLSGDQLAVLIAMVILFSIGRYLFYLQYNQDPRSRALGMVLSMSPSIVGYVAAITLVIMHYV